MSTVKLYTSEQQGAPELRGNASLIAMLDAVLVNGYGEVSVSGITRTSATATVTTATAHGFLTGDIALIAGATQTEYNGEFVITRVSDTQYTYAVTGSPATPATGTITSRRAPAGFAKPYAATNRGVYRSDDTAGLRHFYSFWDDGTTAGGFREGRVRGFVSMSDINTGTDPFPSTAQRTDGKFIPKSSTADAVVRPWQLITNGRTVYLKLSPGGSSVGSGLVGFGDTIPTRAGDTFSSFVAGYWSANMTGHGSNTISALLVNVALSTAGSTPPLYFPRSFTGVGSPTPASVLANTGSGDVLGSLRTPYPHTPDNGFYMMPLLAAHNSIIRARLPGLYESYHGPCFADRTTLSNVQGLLGRTFMMGQFQQGSSSQALLFDLTGPWD